MCYGSFAVPGAGAIAQLRKRDQRLQDEQLLRGEIWKGLDLCIGKCFFSMV